MQHLTIATSSGFTPARSAFGPHPLPPSPVGRGEPLGNCHSRPLDDTILQLSTLSLTLVRSMRDIRVATVQFQHAAGDKAYNFGRIRHFVTEAARARVEMIAFPEMCLTRYWHVRKLARAAFEALAEPVPDGPCTRDLLDLSREHGMTIGAGLLERAPDGGVYNEIGRASCRERV